MIVVWTRLKPAGSFSSGIPSRPVLSLTHKWRRMYRSRVLGHSCTLFWRRKRAVAGPREHAQWASGETKLSAQATGLSDGPHPVCTEAQQKANCQFHVWHAFQAMWCGKVLQCEGWALLELSARKLCCRPRNMVKVKVQGSWIYGSAQQGG
jgi:hypothetical protein